MISVNKKPLRFISLLIGAFLFSQLTFSEEVQLQILESEVKEFEERCLDEAATPSEYCIEEYERLNSAIHRMETEEIQTTCSEEESSALLTSLTSLKDTVSEAAGQLSCKDEDQKHVQKQCAPHLKCNLARSLITTTKSIAPAFIARKVEGGIQKMMGSGQPEQCLNTEQPDCLSQIYHSFVGTLLATFNSLKDIGKVFTGAFWSIKRYLSKKSDDLHSAADTTQSEASLFIQDPGKYIYDKFISFKNGVDGWMKNNLFCQQWEGEPYRRESKCTEPLEQYSCLDCNDGLNAFCAGAGFILSEGVLNIATAGVATGIGIGTRVSAKILGETAQLIATKVPVLARATNRNKVSPTSASLLSKTSQNLGRAKEAVSQFAEKLAKSRAGQMAQKAAHLAMGPSRMVDKVTERTMRVILVRAAKTKGNSRLATALRQTAREDLRAIRGTAENLSSGARRTVMGARVVRLGNRNRPRHRGTPVAGSDVAGTAGHTSSGSTTGTNPGASGHHDSQGGKGGTRTSPGPEQSDSRLRRDEETRRREFEQRQADDDRRRRDEKERRRQEEEDKRDGGSIIPDLTKGLLAGDLLNKGYNAATSSYESGLATEEEVSQALSDESSYDESKSVTENLEARGVVPQDGKSVKDVVEQRAEQYNDPTQRRQVTDRLKETYGISEYDAQKVYDNQKDFYSKARQEFQDTPEAKRLKNRLSSMRSKIQAMNEEVASESIQEEEVTDLPVEELPEAIPTPEERAKRATPSPTPQQARVLGGPTPLPTRAIASTGAFGQSGPSVTPDQDLAQAAVDDYFVPTVNQEELATTEKKKEESQEDAAVVDKDETSEDILSEEDFKIMEQRREANKERVERMEVMALLLTALEGEGLDFFKVDPSQSVFLDEVLNQKGMLIEDLELAVVASHEQKYSVYKNKETHEVFVLNQEGEVMSSLPSDIIKDYY